MNRSINTLLFCCLSYIGLAQINIDSTYSFKDLNILLQEARQNYITKAQKTTEDNQIMADLYFLLAEYEENRFNHKRSMEHYTSSLQFYKQTKDTSQIYRIQETIAERYRKAELFQESLELYQELLEYHTEMNDERKQSIILSNIAKVHRDRGNIDQEQEFINKAINLNKKLRDTSLMIDFVMERVRNYERLNELDSALMIASQVFDLAFLTGDRMKMAESLFYIGYLNKIKSEYDRGLKYLLESEKLIGSIPYSEMRRDLYKEIYDSYSKIDNYTLAFDYSNKYSALNDSILEKDRLESINNLTIKHDADQKRREIVFLEQEQERKTKEVQNQRSALYIMAGGLTLLLILIYYLVRFYTQKIKTEKIIATQKEEINSQKIRELEDSMKMNSMQSMIEGQEIERERIAKDLHDSLGGLLSTIKLQFDSVRTKEKKVDNIKEYNKAHKLLDTAVNEVRTISHNLQPGSLGNLGLVPAVRDLINRFDGEHYPDVDFQYYNLPEKMDHLVVLNIYRIIQELLNNAIKHSKAKEILLQINHEEDDIVIQFEDDGIGFDINNLDKRGMGLDNIKSRINYLKGSVNVESKHAEGTYYLIRVRYK